MPGLADYMDRQSAAGRGYASARGTFRGRQPGGSRLADSGPASRLIADAAPGVELAERVLASLFWWCKTQTAEFEADSRGYGGSPRQRQIIVNHADGTRHDLLLLAPSVPEPFAATVSGPVYTRFSVAQGRPQTISAVALAEGERLRGMLTRSGIASDAPTAVRAVGELAQAADFRLVVAQQPDEMATGELPAEAPTAVQAAVRSFAAPAPALAVTVSGDPRPLATVGVIGTDEGGRLLAVTAMHATAVAEAGTATILAGGQPAGIVGQNVLTDSCLLSVSCRASSATGRAGPLGFAPQEHRAATFEGAASGRKQTMIRGYDLSVLTASPYLSSKVYTDADTVPGDSGAALVDHEDHLVGFAVSRTTFDAPFSFSSWVWAWQVLSAHGLSGPRR
jgi:hypothetical protein